MGWGHHRWLVEAEGRSLTFTSNHHVLCGRPSAQFPYEFWTNLSPEDRVLTFWWDESFEARERFIASAEELDQYLGGSAHRRGRHSDLTRCPYLAVCHNPLPGQRRLAALRGGSEDSVAVANSEARTSPRGGTGPTAARVASPQVLSKHVQVGILEQFCLNFPHRFEELVSSV